MCTAYGNFAILLHLVQHVTGYLLTPKDLDFLSFFGHKRPIMSKNKDVTYTILTLPEAKQALPDFFLSSLLISKTDIGLKLFFRS